METTMNMFKLARKPIEQMNYDELDYTRKIVSQNWSTACRNHGLYGFISSCDCELCNTYRSKLANILELMNKINQE